MIDNEQKASVHGNKNQITNQVWVVNGFQLTHDEICELLASRYRLQVLTSVLKRFGVWEDVLLLIEYPEKYLE